MKAYTLPAYATGQWKGVVSALCAAFFLLCPARLMGQTGNTMSNPIVVGTFGSSYYQYTSSQNTANFTNSYSGNHSYTTNDVFYRFTLTAGMNVEIKHCGSTLPDTYLYLLNASGAEITHNDDYSGACSSIYHSYLQRVLAAGTYYVVSEGYSQNGVIQTAITFNPVTPVGNLFSNPINAGTFSTGFQYTNSQELANFSNAYTERSARDIFYKFTLSQSMTVIVNHCGSSVDTYLHLLNASGSRIGYNDDYYGEGQCSSGLHAYLKMDLAAGTYYVVSESYSALSGVIQTNIMTLTGDHLQNPINAGTFGAGFQYTNTQNIENFTNAYTTRSAKDIFYKFTLSKSMRVVVSHCGSAIDTYLHLLNASGSRIGYNDDYSGEERCSNSLHSYLKMDLAAGTYYVVSESYSAQSGAVQTSIIGFDNEPGYPDMPDAYSADPAAVGTVAGAFDVSATGAATYAIPIEVPPGVGGMQPTLAISYNSQWGNGVAGWGCNLAGVSAITRVPKSIYYDGTAKGLTRLADDGFLLDGQRLMLYSGTAGQEGAVYYPEADPYTRVTVRGSNTATAYSMWFEVLAKDGTKYKYGSAAAERQVYTSGGVSKINAWYLSYVENPLGSYMSYAYTTYSYFKYLSSITYGKNVNEASSLENKVLLTYESRTDATPFVMDGVTGSMSRRLCKVEVKTGSALFREYGLGYTQYDHFSRLTSVTVKNGAGEALHPTQLGWTYLPSYSQSCQTPTVNAALASPSIGFDAQTFTAADLNGDGLADLVGVFPIRIPTGTNSWSNTNYAYVYWASRNASGNVQFLSGQYFDLGAMFSMKDMVSQLGSCSTVDFNGDGVAELLMPSLTIISSIKQVGFRLMNALNDVSFGYNLQRSSEIPPYATGDFNNDGKGDVVYVERGESNGRYPCEIVGLSSGTSLYRASFNLTLPAKPERIYVSDFNGNGLNDLMVVHAKGYSIFWNQGYGITSSTLSDNAKTTGTSVAYYRLIYPDDFNGDGLQDFIMSATNNSSWYFALNNGNGTFTQTQACTLNLYDQDFTGKDDDKFSCIVYDFDFDGKSDVIIQKSMYNKITKNYLVFTDVWGEFHKTYTCWLRSTGTGLSAVASATSNSEADAYSKFYVAGDFNGDGQPDLMNYGYNCYNASSTSRVWRLYKSSGFTASSGKLTTVTNGYGSATGVSYDMLTNADTYTKGSGAQYPTIDVKPPLAVVKSVVADNGVAGNTSVTYKYAGAKMHLQGKGFLGFASRTANNTTMGVASESGVKAWSATYYAPSEIYEKTTVDGKTAETAVKYTFVNKGGKRYFAHPNAKIEKDLDGNVDTTTYTFDANGNLTEEKTLYGGSSMYSTTRYGTYVTTGGGTAPSKPRLITSIQKHADDGATFTRKTYMTYNTAKGYPTQKIENYGTTLALTTSYTYDSFGNLTASTVSGSGVPAITSNRDYDATKRFVAKEYTSPASTVYTYAYDTWGNLTTERDETNTANKLSTTHAYNRWGQRTATTHPDGRKTTYATGWRNANTAKRYFTLTQSTGQPWIKTWYDRVGRETAVETVGPKGLSITTVSTYNSKGLLTKTEEKQGNLTMDGGIRLRR